VRVAGQGSFCCHRIRSKEERNSVLLAQLIADNTWFVAAAWMGLALLASLISIRLGVSVALIEIGMGVIGGNFLGFQTTPWIDFLATFGSGLLTFLAGAEIDPDSLRRHLKPTLVIGSVAFIAPFLGAWLFAQYIAGWEQHQAWIAGIALSTTSVAVVYAVMIETGLNQTELGKMILAACFVNDFGTVLALGALFANFNGFLVLFVAVLAVSLFFMPPLDALHHQQRRQPGFRAGDQVHLLHAVPAGWLCHRREQRSGAAGLPGRPGDRRCLCSRQSAGQPHA
jgi:hypothetical protein